MIRRIIVISLVISMAALSAVFAGGKQQARQLSRAVTGNNEFAFEIYRKLAAQNTNLFISPLSMVTAFSMVHAGSRGGTRREIEKVFHLKGTGEDVSRDWGAMLDDMSGRAKSGKYRFDTANRVWIGKHVAVEDAFTATMKKYYNAGLKQVDFAGDPDGSRSVINKWVAANTNDKITGLVPEGAVTRATSLVLTNAVYFLGSWESPFDEKSTAKSDFFITPAQKTEVPMMKNFGHFNYYENNEIQAVSLPYKTRGNKDDALSMVILLPKGRTGLAGIEKKLTVDSWRKWSAGLARNEVYVYVPRFEITSFASLAETLRTMGMKTAFSPQADFSGIAPKLGISDAFHKAYVKVNEKGTEAAAATTIIMVKANGGKKHTFRADHPFLFLICDNRTGAVIFIGRVTDPAG